MTEKYTEEVYRQAILKWKESNPDKTNLDMPYKETINLDGIGTIKIGQKIKILRNTYNAQIRGERFGTFKKLTEEQIAWWNSQGMDWDYKKHQEQRNGKLYQKK